MLLCALTACGAQPGPSLPKGRRVAPGVSFLGPIANPRLTESSGVVLGRKNPDTLWTHNDGGGRRQVLYAVTRSGRPVADFRVTGALLDDWEDIASDEQGHLFLGDIGDNDRARRTISVHQVDEPDLSTNRSGSVAVTRSWNLKYPGERFNAEALVVRQGNGYIITKVFDDARAEMYRFPLDHGPELQTLQLVTELRIDSPVTGADISPDGRLLGIVSKAGAFVYRIDGDLGRVADVKPYRTKFEDAHIEGCTFVPEGLLATAETRAMYLFTDEPFRTGPAAAQKRKK